MSPVGRQAAVDPRTSRENVLAAIHSQKHRGRVIWSPSTTLAAMGIERYPHDPHHNYRRMKGILAGLCEEGYLVARPRLHQRFTMQEKAYERPPPIGLARAAPEKAAPTG